MPAILYLLGAPQGFLVAEDPDVVEQKLSEAIEEQKHYVRLNSFNITANEVSVPKNDDVPIYDGDSLQDIIARYAEMQQQAPPEPRIEYKDSFAEIRIRVDQVVIIRQPHDNEVPDPS